MEIEQHCEIVLEHNVTKYLHVFCISAEGQSVPTHLKIPCLLCTFYLLVLLDMGDASETDPGFPGKTEF